MDSDRFALDDVIPPPVVLLTDQHTADGSLDANDVRRHKVELLLLLLVLTTCESGTGKRLKAAHGRLDLDLLQSRTHPDVVLARQHAANLGLYTGDSITRVAQTSDRFEQFALG